MNSYHPALKRNCTFNPRPKSPEDWKRHIENKSKLRVKEADYRLKSNREIYKNPEIIETTVRIKRLKLYGNMIQMDSTFKKRKLKKYGM